MSKIRIQRKGTTRLISQESWNLLSAKAKSEWNIVDGETVQPKAASFMPPEVRALKSNPNVVSAIPVVKEEAQSNGQTELQVDPETKPLIPAEKPKKTENAKNKK